MDIREVEKEKKLIRLTLWLLRKKLSVSKIEQIREDLLNCPDPLIKKLHKIILSTINEIQSDFQRNTLIDLFELGLWILAYKDTAYNDWVRYTLKQLFGDDELRELVKDAKPPDKWHVNMWIKSKEYTKKLRAEGKLSNEEISEFEKLFIPSYIDKKR